MFLPKSIKIRQSALKLQSKMSGVFLDSQCIIYILFCKRTWIGISHQHHLILNGPIRVGQHCMIVTQHNRPTSPLLPASGRLSDAVPSGNIHKPIIEMNPWWKMRIFESGMFQTKNLSWGLQKYLCFLLACWCMSKILYDKSYFRTFFKLYKNKNKNSIETQAI